MEWNDKYLKTGSNLPFQSFETLENSKMKLPNGKHYFKDSVEKAKVASTDLANTNAVSNGATPTNSIMKTSDSICTTMVHPRKRGGFQITNVEDLSGDESEEDDQAGVLSSSNDCTDGNSFDRIEFGALPRLSENNESSISFMNRKQKVALDQEQALTNGARDVHGKMRSKSATVPPTWKANQPNEAKIRGPITPSHQFDEPIATNHRSHEPITANNSTSTANLSSIKSRSTVSSTPTPLKPGRVFRVLKRESTQSIQPIKCEAGRWMSFDYSDLQTPNFALAVQSQSDIVSLPHPDAYTTCCNPIGTNLYPINNNSSLNSSYVDGVKVGKLSKSIFEFSDGSVEGKARSDDSRASEAGNSDQEASNNAARYSDGASISDDDSCISPNLRLDNKIAAAMDLVKMHLMLAVRDEIDELKKRIIELESENEAMKEVLTVDQRSHLQSNRNSSFKSISRPLLQTQSSYVQSTANHNHVPLPVSYPYPANSQSTSNSRHNQSHATLQSPQAKVNSMSMQIPASAGQFQPNQPMSQQLTSNMSPPVVSPLEQTPHFASPFKRQTSVNGSPFQGQTQPHIFGVSTLTSPTYTHLPSSHPYTYPSPSRKGSNT